MTEQPSKEMIAQIFHHLPLYQQAFLPDIRNILKNNPTLKPSHIKAIMFLLFNGETTMTGLSKLLRMEKGSVTAVAEHLVNSGYICRVADPEDRRKSLLQLTGEGLQFAESFKSAHISILESRLDRLSEEDRQSLFISIRQLNDLLIKIIDSDQHMNCCHHSPSCLSE